MGSLNASETKINNEKKKNCNNFFFLYCNFRVWPLKLKLKFARNRALQQPKLNIKLWHYTCILRIIYGLVCYGARFLVVVVLAAHSPYSCPGCHQ